jgi:transcriptional regulator with XRE-family HTH domain
MTKGSLDKRLRVLRAERGYSLTNASERIGIDRHTLRQLELGEREPYYGTLRKIAAGYGVEIEDLVETPAEDAQEAPRERAPSAPVTKSETVARPPRKEDLSHQDPRPGAEAFVERWGEMASAIKTIKIEGTGIQALLRTAEWAVTAEANILFREFLAVPPYVIRSSDVTDLVPLSYVFNKVYMAAEGLRGALRMVDSGTGLHASELRQEEEREYLGLRDRARDHVRGSEAWIGEPGEDDLATGVLGTIGSSDLEKTRRNQARSN